VLAFSVALVAVPVAAQQAPSEQPPKQADHTMTVRGELLTVNTETKTLTVKTADNAEVAFQFDDATDVTGAKDGAAGLATMTNRRVTVHYTEDAASKVKLAKRIIVEPAQ
jgi:hypothetical protein